MKTVDALSIARMTSFENFVLSSTYGYVSRSITRKNASQNAHTCEARASFMMRLRGSSKLSMPSEPASCCAWAMDAPVTGSLALGMVTIGEKRGDGRNAWRKLVVGETQGSHRRARTCADLRTDACSLSAVTLFLPSSLTTNVRFSAFQLDISGPC